MAPATAPMRGGPVIGKPRAGTSQVGGKGADGKGLKRTRPSVSPNTQPCAKKRQRISPSPKSFSEALTAERRLAIAPANYPESTLTEAQASAIEQEIVGALCGLKKGETMPHFDECRFGGGLLLVTCAHTGAVEWLRATATSIRPWEGADLQVMDSHRLPRLKRMFTVIPGPPVATEAILRMMEGQNPGVRTNLWRVWSRKEGPNLVTLVPGVDPVSHGLIKRQGSEVHVGLRRALFREGPAGTTEDKKNPDTFGGNKPGLAAPVVEEGKVGGERCGQG
ncbi:uncharacterized protein LOC114881848 [Osmia bicornis bicornis]|uniref:uncharacterized protein LOC114881848 n=1 Tax=Osmia bicornis bicornis TaxID=1437191 RepID=UPI0010F4FA4F|nr:uncharacterized protein LOC114881848 [Osmia bicornis bicornis]